MSGLPILLVDAEGRIVKTNAEAEKLLGSCLDQYCADIVGARDRFGHAICKRGCHTEVIEHTHGESDGDHFGALIKGTSARVVCSRLGENVAVVLLPAPEVDSRVESLTDRERDVLALVARGMSSGAIGEKLGISGATVRTHVQHVRELGATTRAEAVAKALATGQIT